MLNIRWQQSANCARRGFVPDGNFDAGLQVTIEFFKQPQA